MHGDHSIAFSVCIMSDPKPLLPLIATHLCLGPPRPPPPDRCPGSPCRCPPGPGREEGEDRLDGIRGTKEWAGSGSMGPLGEGQWEEGEEQHWTHLVPIGSAHLQSVHQWYL